MTNIIKVDFLESNLGLYQWHIKSHKIAYSL